MNLRVLRRARLEEDPQEGVEEVEQSRQLLNQLEEFGTQVPGPDAVIIIDGLSHRIAAVPYQIRIIFLSERGY